jgi:hypothetical protein
MKIALLAASAALLAGCAVTPAEWRAETVLVIEQLSVPAMQPRLRTCSPMDPAIAVEAQRVTPIEHAGGNLDALAAALIAAEARKNVRLRQALAAVERCRLAQTR